MSHWGFLFSIYIYMESHKIPWFRTTNQLSFKYVFIFNIPDGPMVPDGPTVHPQETRSSRTMNHRLRLVYIQYMYIISYVYCVYIYIYLLCVYIYIYIYYVYL